MPNGAPGDHPLNDILVHGSTVFSPEADEMVRQLACVYSHEEMHELLVWFHLPTGEALEARLRALLEARRAEARRRGWEDPDSEASPAERDLS